MTQIKLGAPSITGKDANVLVEEAFARAKYPLAVNVKNHMPRDVVFPEVPGLFLKHVANVKGNTAKVKIADHALFQRLASSIEQIAELNRYPLAVTISDGEIEEEAAAPEAPESLSPAADTVRKPSDGLTHKQLEAALAEKGIAIPKNASKTELAALLDAAPVQ